MYRDVSELPSFVTVPGFTVIEVWVPVIEPPVAVTLCVPTVFNTKPVKVLVPLDRVLAAGNVALASEEVIVTLLAKFVSVLV